tara:strand:- start:7830 stop:8222 length:393 start_codon:yes stop_codon:yes gene_type:complete
MSGYINSTSLRAYRTRKIEGYERDDWESKYKTTVYRIGLYLCNRVEYSAAEGGCWVTVGELRGESPRVFTDYEKARGYREELDYRVNRRYNEPMGSRADLSSVNCEGHYMVQIWEDNLPEGFPTGPVHYE